MIKTSPVWESFSI